MIRPIALLALLPLLLAAKGKGHLEADSTAALNKRLFEVYRDHASSLKMHPPESADELAFDAVEQPFLEHASFFIGSGTYEGGHAFYAPTLLMARGADVRVVSVGMNDGSWAWEEPRGGIKRVLACSPTFGSQAVGQKGATYDALEKKECVDLTASLAASITPSAEEGKLRKFAELLLAMRDHSTAVRIVDSESNLDGTMKAALHGTDFPGITIQKPEKPFSIVKPVLTRAKDSVTLEAFAVQSEQGAAALVRVRLILDAGGFALAKLPVARWDGVID